MLVEREEAASASEVLAQAFQNESATDYFFPPEEGGKLEKLRALFGWAVDYRMRTGVPVLGVRSPSLVFEARENEGGVGEGDSGTSTSLPPSSLKGGGGVLAGVATLRTPVMPDLAEAEAMWQEVANFIGPAAEARMGAYEEAQQRHRPQAPHHYLVAIGVHPDHQGKGYGGALIRAAIAMAEADPESAGIALDTGSASNQALYEHFGFHVTGTETLGEKTGIFMFRPRAMI